MPPLFCNTCAPNAGNPWDNAGQLRPFVSMTECTVERICLIVRPAFQRITLNTDKKIDVIKCQPLLLPFLVPNNKSKLIKSLLNKDGLNWARHLAQLIKTKTEVPFLLWCVYCICACVSVLVVNLAGWQTHALMNFTLLELLLSDSGREMDGIRQHGPAQVQQSARWAGGDLYLHWVKAWQPPHFVC